MPGRSLPFLGRRRRCERGDSHSEVVYEPGKCLMCDACVRIVAEVGEELGVSIALRSGRAGDLFGCEGCSVEPI